jgi:protein TonB
MNERLFITVPSSFALWGIVIMLVTLALNREVARPMMGQDTITVRLVSIASKPAPKTQEVTPPSKPAPVKVSKPKPVPKQPVQQETAAPKQQWTEAKTDTHGAVITYQPMPKIPDDLRREAFNTYAMARFHVAAGGSATVELLTPSQNPRLNRLLLEALKTWRFTPATDNGKPVASTFDIRVRFAVE